MSQTTTLTDVRTVALPVADQDRALEFYVHILGFEKRMDAPIGEGFRWVEVAPPGAAVSIALSPASAGSIPTRSCAGRTYRRCSPSPMSTATPSMPSRLGHQ